MLGETARSRMQIASRVSTGATYGKQSKKRASLPREAYTMDIILCAVTYHGRLSYSLVVLG